MRDILNLAKRVNKYFKIKFKPDLVCSIIPYVSSIHPGLHVSHVKLAYGDHLGTLPFPVDPTSPPYPIAILDRKMVRRRHVPATKLLYNHFRV